MTTEEFKNVLLEKENTHLDFKEARGEFPFDGEKGVCDYCCAFANENGGMLVLGVTDKTRKVVGTCAFMENWNTLSHSIFQAIGIRVDVEEFFYQGNRVLVFHIPKHFPGQPVKYRGQYRMRAGESLVAMNEQRLKEIFDEVRPDFSANVIPEILLEDLDPIAVENLRRLRAKKTKNERAKTDPIEKLLSDAGLTRDRKCTFACLVLLGKEEKIRQFAPQAEIIYEWRTRDGQTHYDFRKEWRVPYLSIYDDIWETINARNIQMPFLEGFDQRTIDAFDKESCREAVNNAVMHRDYAITSGSIFIHASPERFSVTSPGGFLPGITEDNIFGKSEWRNRCMADALGHTELIERSGQGIDDIFEASIRQGKGLPNFRGTDAYSVTVNIPTVLRDPEFVKFLEKLVNEKQIALSFDDFMELERLRAEGSVRDLQSKERFLRLGIIEKIGKTRGMKYILSHRYYKHEKRIGKYTQIKGLARESKKELILRHIREQGSGKMEDFSDAFPEMSTHDITNLLQELKRDGLIHREGWSRSAVWRTKDN